MVVQVDQIRDEGLTVREPLSQELLSAALSEQHDTGFRAAGPSELKAELHKVSGGVLLHGEAQVSLTALCKRCLTDVQLSVPVTFDLNLVQANKAQAGDDELEGEDDEAGELGGSFDLKTADQETFDGKQIDLDPIVREQVLLALPMHAVCREDCKGLCGMCGQNLNEKACGCEEKRVDPRLAALKDIKLN